MTHHSRTGCQQNQWSASAISNFKLYIHSSPYTIGNTDLKILNIISISKFVITMDALDMYTVMNAHY